MVNKLTLKRIYSSNCNNLRKVRTFLILSTKLLNNLKNHSSKYRILLINQAITSIKIFFNNKKILLNKIRHFLGNSNKIISSNLCNNMYLKPQILRLIISIKINSEWIKNSRTATTTFFHKLHLLISLLITNNKILIH